MNDDQLPQKVPSQNNASGTNWGTPNKKGESDISEDSEQYTRSNQVFDISVDTIKPVTDESAEEAGPFDPQKRFSTGIKSSSAITLNPSPIKKPTNPVISNNNAPDAKPATGSNPIKEKIVLTPVSAFNSNLRQIDQKTSPPPAPPVIKAAEPVVKNPPVTVKPSPKPQIPVKPLQTPSQLNQLRNAPPINQPPAQQPIALVKEPQLEQNIFPTKLPLNMPPQTSDPDGKFPTQVAKPLRTYESDVAEVMSHRRTSTASIAIAESKKAEGEERISNNPEPVTSSSHAGTKITLVLLSILLLGAGVVGAYYLYSMSALAPIVGTPVQQHNSSVSFVPKDTQTVVTIDSLSPVIIQSRIQAEISKTQTPNTIKEIIPAAKNSVGTLVRISAPDMLHDMDITVPDILSRSITNDWMLGVYADSNDNKSLIIVVNSIFFQNTFAGMLQWESVMADELKLYLYPMEPAGISNSSVQQNNATSTPNAAVGTTTPDTTEPLRTYVTIRGRFEDKIIKNKDVREFRTDAGETLFLYSFVDNTHLVVTSNEATLTEILDRLEKQAFLR